MKELSGGFKYLSPPDIFQSCLEMGGWSWHIGTYHWVRGFRKHFFIRSGKKLLDPVGIFISNLMHGSIFDTDYAAMQTDLSKLQGEEEKRRLPLPNNKNCLLQGNLLSLQGLSLTTCLPKTFLKKPFRFFNYVKIIGNCDCSVICEGIELNQI